MFSDTLAALSRAFTVSKENPDSAYTAEGFSQRYAAGAGLNLYALSEYQAAPGTMITAQGSGFSKTGNTIHIGGSSVSGVESLDGFTMAFTLPSMNNGTYEAWVENEKGSSRKGDRPISIMVTSSPAPRPLIRSVSPAMPSAADTLTLYGENLGSSATVVTTFGIKEGMPANGGSLTLKLSDLPYFQKVRDVPAVKGSKVSFFIYVQNENGVSRQPFIFDIQF